MIQSFEDEVIKLLKSIEEVKNGNRIALPGNTFFLKDNKVLSVPREDGDSRYPYTYDGLVMWAYASGYLQGSDDRLTLFLQKHEGQEPNIGFFAGFPKGNGAYDPIPLLGVPVKAEEDEANRYVIFGPEEVYYFTEISQAIFVVRMFVSAEKEICFSAMVQNNGDQPLEILLSSFINPFLRYDKYDNNIIRWWKECKIIDNKRTLRSYLFKVEQDMDRTTTFTNYGVIHRDIQIGNNSKLINCEETPSRRQYVGGKSRNLGSSTPLVKGTFGVPTNICTFTDVAIAGDIINLKVGEKDTIRLDVCFETCTDGSQLNSKICKSIDAAEVDRKLALLKDKELREADVFSVFTGDFEATSMNHQVFNSFLTHVKRQVDFCAFGKNYAGPLLGIRDVFQHLEAALLWKPEQVRLKMLEALNFIAPNGRCPRQYSLPTAEGQMPAMDLRLFIDQGVWVISTIISYLRTTKDFNFLHEECGYYEIIDERSNKVVKSHIKDSVLEHMFKIMDYFLHNIDYDFTNCVYALYGDWNDALDGLGVTNEAGKEYGTGVSVMVTLQVYQNLNEMVELLTILDSQKYKKLIDQYKEAAAKIEEGLNQYAVVESERGDKRILHGWGDQRSYCIGSFCDSDGQSRYGLTSNAFWVLSGMLDTRKEMRQTILDSFHYLDSKYGLKTFEPYFSADIFGVGRIAKLPPGTAENGAAYIHASMFGIAALFKMGCSEFAWNQLEKSFPFTHHTISCSPFIMPNSYCYNKERNIDGESMNDWHTGSANVLIKTLVKYVFGIDPQFSGVMIQPSAWMPFKEFKFEIKLGGCILTVYYRKSGNQHRVFKVNDTEVDSIFDETMKTSKILITDEQLQSEQMSIVIMD